MKVSTVFIITGTILVICGFTLIHIANKTGLTVDIINTYSEIFNPGPIKPYIPTKPIDQQIKEEFEQRNQFIRTDKLLIHDIIHVLGPRQYKV